MKLLMFSLLLTKAKRCVIKWFASVRGQTRRSIIGDIDLNKDKLIIYGTEIKEAAMLQKLYDCLRLGPSGTVFVNCNGECNIWISKSGFDRLHHNITFDWSPFGSSCSTKLRQ